MGRKTVHFWRKSQAEFAKAFKPLCETKSSWQVWADFVKMSSLSIANTLDQKGPTHDAREQEYLSTIKQYTKEQQQVFPELLAIMVNALEEDPQQDFLGEMFMCLELGNHWKEQFFTPYSVCQLMATMSINDKERTIQEHGWVGILDSCCGAGALSIASRNEMVRRGYGPTQMLFVAQDIDRTTAMMCYLQLSLLGCAGYVVVGDALLQPMASPTGSSLLIAPSAEHEVWFMPAFYNDTWRLRVQIERTKLLIQEADS